MGFRRWGITVWLALALTAFDGLLLAVTGTDEAGVRVLVRATARIAVALFIGVFAASSLQRLWPTPLSRWLRANRRYLGVTFAVGFGLHLLSLLLLGALHPDPFLGDLEVPTLVIGGIASALIAAMAFTSSNRAQVRLGERWRQLHLVGGYAAWAIFVQSYAGRVLEGWLEPLLLALLLGALALRIAARRRPGYQGGSAALSSQGRSPSSSGQLSRRSVAVDPSPGLYSNQCCSTHGAVSSSRLRP